MSGMTIFLYLRSRRKKIVDFFHVLETLNNNKNMSNESITSKMKTFKMSDVATHGEFADTQW